jgi:2-acylglycerol O-acyltransferase 2
MIVVGGAREALDAHPKTTDLTLICRKGFVREALMAGASLVPVFGFGENDLYEQLDNKRGSILRERQEKLMRRFGFSMPLFQGRGVFNYSFGLLPQRRRLTAVVGAPIPLPQVDNPSREQILQYHKLYVDALTKLFRDHKDQYAQPGTQDLEVVG